ncbi:MAG: hypothetical protein KKA41_11375, partial [Proteobacteria bacterium]|nr:hypothetical protein [Pseudomonadota bacterium]
MIKPWNKMAWAMAFTVFSLAGSALAAPGKGADQKINYIRQFKPLAISPSLTIPSGDSAKEVGGIAYGRHVDVKLADGSTVRCFPTATTDPEKPGKNYYYLPTNPHVSKFPDGMPKFSMIRFVSDKAKEAGGAEGAVLHFLVEYGLDQAQQQETAKLLQKQVKDAVLKGAVPLEVGAEGNSFNVISAVLGDKNFAPTLITSGKAPVMEGQQVAVAARLDAYGATLLAKGFEQPTSQVSVAFDLKYVVKLPAYDVKVTIDYDKFN